MTTSIPQVIDHAAHTAFSDPRDFAALFDEIAPTPEPVSAVARNLVVHYAATGQKLPEASMFDIHARWLDEILRLDQSRHPHALTVPREEKERVQGCCRDHSLTAIGIL